MKKLLNAIVFLFLTAYGFSQNAATKQLSLDDMSAFKPTAGNWFIVGDVTMDRTIDEHHAPEPAAPLKKNRRNRKLPVQQETHHAVSYQSGKGVLLNLP